MTKQMNHEQICNFLGVDVSTPAPQWTPYAIRLTKIEIFISGDRSKVWGGAHKCGKCGFGIDIMPTGDRCPECNWNGTNDGSSIKESNIGSFKGAIISILQSNERTRVVPGEYLDVEDVAEQIDQAAKDSVELTRYYSKGKGRELRKILEMVPVNIQPKEKKDE